MSETIKVKNRGVGQLLRGLDSLDGVNMEGQVEPFEFAAEVQWNLAKNAVLVQRAKETLDLAVGKLKASHKVIQGEQMTEANRERLVAFQADVDAMMEIEVEISGLLFVTLDQLRGRPDRGSRKPGTNLLPVSLLKNLNPIIRET